MKKFMLLLLLVATGATAEPFQSEKSVWCDDVKIVLEALASRYHEKPMWVGKDLKTSNMYIMTTSEKEATWTFIETNGQVACILGAGTDSNLRLGEKI